MTRVIDTDEVTVVHPAVELGEREELTEHGVVEKVVHPAHGRMESQLNTTLVGLGVSPARIYHNVRLAPFPSGTRYVPDMFVVRDVNPSQPLDEADYAGIPDLIIEVLSPGDDDRARDLEEKRRAYAACGVPAYWIADPIAQTVTDGYHQKEWLPLNRVTLPW